ncbi:MAG: dihydropteroate synthase [Bacteroidota bacterium]
MTINLKGKLMDFEVPKVMGILNTTPDSFFDGGKYLDENKILLKAEQLLSDGADILDIGGYSSRPGAKTVSVEEEMNRTVPAIQLILDKFPDVIVSVDTFRSQVAEQAINAGAALINDISAGELDEKMLPIVAKYNVPYIMMHMRGTPQNMQSDTSYENLINEIRYYFSEKIAQARALGISDVIIDPGFGFSKDLEQNYQLLQNLDLFTEFEVPMLAGLSRKSMIYKVLDCQPQEALAGTISLNTIALQKGAHILRVHDVKEAKAIIQLMQKFN